MLFADRISFVFDCDIMLSVSIGGIQRKGLGPGGSGAGGISEGVFPTKAAEESEENRLKCGENRK